jgi:two-component system, OmpR family, phosphate regulon response regulator PhoB
MKMDGCILVVEDDAPTRDLLTANLELAGYRVSCACDVAEARALASEARPDVVLLDRMLTGHPALTYARQLRGDRRTAGVAIIVIGAGVAHGHDAVAALESGADDYLVKPIAVNELLARIKAIMRRRAPQLDDAVVAVAGLQFDPAARRVWHHDREVCLCPIEYRLLHYFITHPGRILSRRKLLDEVWGEHVCIEERTVDLHIRRLRRALDPTGHGALIDTVRGLGYQFRADPNPARLAVRDPADAHAAVVRSRHDVRAPQFAAAPQ